MATTLLTIESTDAGTWGLDYTSWPPNDQYAYTYDGSGVDAYVVDTGMLLTNQEFGGRATCGTQIVADSGSAGNIPCHDGNSHGTHVAGIIGGRTVGMAKQVNLISVKVIDQSGSGSMANVAAGVDWVVSQKQTGAASGRPMLINLSIGGGKSSTLNQAINNAVNAGIVVVGAAANGATDACNTSPASATEAIIVGAAAQNSKPASFSNYGSCLDVWAPGINIQSAGISSDTAYAYKSGTSQATPFVSGLAALYLQSGLGPTEISTAIVADARFVSALSEGGSPALIAYSGVLAGLGPAYTNSSSTGNNGQKTSNNVTSTSTTGTVAPGTAVTQKRRHQHQSSAPSSSPSTSPPNFSNGNPIMGSSTSKPNKFSSRKTISPTPKPTTRRYWRRHRTSAPTVAPTKRNYWRQHQNTTGTSSPSNLRTR